MRERLLALLENSLPEIDFTSSDSLVDDGIVDSMQIVTIMAEISMEFQIIIPFDQVISANFNSVDNMLALITKVQEGSF